VATYQVLNDEPSGKDTLGRLVLARTFAQVASECQTPLVIGVYGSWGSGKTTFLKLIESELDQNHCKPVWFNAWQHDHDAAPAISLLHSMVDGLDLTGEFKNALSQVAVAFGSVLLQKTTSLTLDNLQKIQALLDQEGFRVRDARSKLKTYFSEVIAKARPDSRTRIVFFVDDLDRCESASVVKLLEAIKLYFNAEGCVFILGLDRDSIAAALSQARKPNEANEAQYLDKLIQLPFTLPPIADSTFSSYLSELVPADLALCIPLIQTGLGRNPRTAKRFINDLVLRHRFALTLHLTAYDPRLLTLLLLFDHLNPVIFKRLTSNPELLVQLRADRHFAETEINNARLIDALFRGYVPEFGSIESYVGLTKLDAGKSAAVASSMDVGTALKRHANWLGSFGARGECAQLRGINLSDMQLPNVRLRDAHLDSALIERSNLRRGDFRRASLAGARMAHSDLSGACLRDADLREADLGQANMRAADLRGADMRRTNLCGADLRQAIGMSEDQVRECILDKQTRLPLYLPQFDTLAR
jgi:uncharacterized protein YjbI with pentapeptide repeats/molybdopterin-guanine dinucleotide biosynthesis protein